MLLGACAYAQWFASSPIYVMHYFLVCVCPFQTLTKKGLGLNIWKKLLQTCLHANKCTKSSAHVKIHVFINSSDTSSNLFVYWFKILWENVKLSLCSEICCRNFQLNQSNTVIALLPLDYSICLVGHTQAFLQGS